MTLNPQHLGDPVIFENAAISIAAVRDILEREGQREAALTLRGLEVLDPTSAAVALDALRLITVRTPDIEDVLSWAVPVLYRASRASMSAIARCAA